MLQLSSARVLAILTRRTDSCRIAALFTTIIATALMDLFEEYGPDMINHYLNDSPNAMKCRSLLIDCPGVRETREGKIANIFLFLVGGIVCLSLTLFAVVVSQIHVALISLVLMWLPITAYMVSREQGLCLQNDADKIFSYLGQFLNEGEKPLVLLSGRAYSMSLPEWLPNDFYPHSFFVFTSDRLIVIALSAQEMGMKKISDFHKAGTFSSVVSSIYTCDIWDERSVKIGGFVGNILALTHTKIQIRPIGETQPYTWLLETRGTNNGKLVKRIWQVLSSSRAKT